MLTPDGITTWGRIGQAAVMWFLVIAAFLAVWPHVIGRREPEPGEGAVLEQYRESSSEVQEP